MFEKLTKLVSYLFGGENQNFPNTQTPMVFAQTFPMLPPAPTPIPERAQPAPPVEEKSLDEQLKLLKQQTTSKINTQDKANEFLEATNSYRDCIMDMNYIIPSKPAPETSTPKVSPNKKKL